MPDRSRQGISNLAWSARTPRAATNRTCARSTPPMDIRGVPSNSVNSPSSETSYPADRSGPIVLSVKLASHRTDPVRLWSPARSARPLNLSKSGFPACAEATLGRPRLKRIRREAESRVRMKPPRSGAKVSWWKHKRRPTSNFHSGSVTRQLQTCPRGASAPLSACGEAPTPCAGFGAALGDA